VRHPENYLFECSYATSFLCFIKRSSYRVCIPAIQIYVLH